ncbi:MAG: phosphonate ABC transporter, permease protein PhnE, partial [Chloroflexi bacterium]|nr:phosphonate ABC transporter, permease protein PhnE [Chloroflexota bacterium]
AFMVLILATAYAYGFRVTKVNLYDLVTGLPNMRHIVLSLLQPDLFVRAIEMQKADTPFLVRAESRPPEPPPAAPPVKPGPSVEIHPSVAKPGDAVEVKGRDFKPNTPGLIYLIWVGDTRLGKITTDAQGDFAATVVLPGDVTQGDYWIEARVFRELNWYVPSETLILSLRLMLETIFLALIGTTFSVVFSIPLSFLGARNLMMGTPFGRATYYLSRTFFNLLRSIEVLIIVVIMAVVVGIGPFAGVLALAVHGIGALGKLYSESIESIDPGPIEAITATGASRLQVIAYAVVPQIVPQFCSFTLYRWDIYVRMATVIGLVGGGGIGFILIQYINLLQWNQAGTAIWLIAIVVMAMDYASAVIREKIV